MAERVEIDLDVTAEAKRRIADLFKNSLIDAEIARMQKAAQPSSVARMEQFVQGASQVASGIDQARGIGSTLASGNVGGALSMGAGAIGSIGGPIAGAVAQVAGQIASAIQDAFRTTVGFIRDFNPGGVQLLDQAFKDIGAVIGRTLNPLLQVFIPLVRSFGDFVATVAPDMSGLVSSMKPFVNLVRESAKLLASLAAGPMQKFVDMLTGMLTVLGQIANAIAWVVEQANRLPGRSASKSSYGVGSTGAQSSSIADFGRSAQIAAYGMGDALNYDKQTADNTAVTAAAVSGLVTLVKGITQGWASALMPGG